MNTYLVFGRREFNASFPNIYMCGGVMSVQSYNRPIVLSQVVSVWCSCSAYKQRPPTVMVTMRSANSTNDRNNKPSSIRHNLQCAAQRSLCAKCVMRCTSVPFYLRIYIHNKLFFLPQRRFNVLCPY